MFETKDLLPYFQSQAEKAFLEVLIATNLVRYDWGSDYLWVWRSHEKNPIPGEETPQMGGEEFHGKLYSSFGSSHLNWPTSAGFVVDLLACGIDVQIAIDEPFAEGYLTSLVACARSENPTGKIGTVLQFVPVHDRK
mgnify:FL=1